MSFDINKHREPNETERVWQMKKMFIERHRDKFDEKRLLCLAQCYINIESIGCRYSNEIMQQIKELTKDFEISFKERIDDAQPNIKTQQPTKLNNKINIANKNKNFQTNNYSKSKLISKTPLQAKIENDQLEYKKIEQKFQLHTRDQPKLKDLTQFFKPASSANPSSSSSMTQAGVSFSTKVKTTNNSDQEPQKPQTVKAPTPKKNVALLSLLKSTNNGSGSTLTAAPQSTTTELAPAPSTLPIPFGLSSASNNNNNNNNNSSNPKNKSDPISLLLSGSLTPATGSQHTNSSQPDTLNSRLGKIKMLSQAIKSDIRSLTLGEDDLVAYLEEMCKKLSLKLSYKQAELSNDLYKGELELESVRLSANESKKRKKCKINCYRSGLNLLKSSDPELAVRICFNASKNQEEFELYAISSSVVNSDEQQSTRSAPKPSIIDKLILKQPNSNFDDLNQMLKSLIIKKDVPNQTNSSSNLSDKLNGLSLNMNGSNRSSSSIKENLDANVSTSELKEKHSDEHNDDDEDGQETVSEELDRKSKMLKNMPNFCLLISCNSSDRIDVENLEPMVHTRNSIQILSESCVKSGCNLEFEFKMKSACVDANGSKSFKIVEAATANTSLESDSNDEPANLNKKYKCKVLINGVKVASSSSSRNKADSKRAAALRAVKCLAKVFPVIKLNKDLYQQQQQQPQPEQSASNANSTPSTTKYIKISKDDLFNGIIPSILMPNELTSASQASNFGYGLLRKMGWKGEGFGLGKHQQGPVKPVEMSFNSNRLGLGYEFKFDDYLTVEEKEEEAEAEFGSKLINNAKMEPRLLANNVVHLLNRYLSSASTRCDLIFDSRLSGDERKLIHRHANRLSASGLDTKSHGKAEARFLVVSKKQNLAELVQRSVHPELNNQRYELVSVGSQKPLEQIK